MADMIKVRATKNEGVRVFQEEHPDHPNGSVDIWGTEGTHTVALTPGIQRAIEQGMLQQVGEAAQAPVPTETQELPVVKEIEYVSTSADPAATAEYDQTWEPVDKSNIEIVALIPNYDDLTVEDIKTMAKQLTPEEREALRVYEIAHKNRASLLAALGKFE